jgi:thermosome
MNDMMGGQVPVLLLKEGSERSKGKGAQLNNIAAAKAIADALRTTLGPRGMDKMLVDGMGDVVITNDGATILKEIDVEHPAAKMVVEVAKTQDEECGDGTTTAVVIAGELLKRSEELIEQNVHPTMIVNGYRRAADEAVKILDDISVKVDHKDTSMLTDIAVTAMSGKSVGGTKEHLAEIAVNAVNSIAEHSHGKWTVDIDDIKVEKKHGGSITDTRLIDGLILDKEKVHPKMPSSVSDCKIALLDFALEIKKTEVSAEIQIKDPKLLTKFVEEEESTLKGFVEKVKNAGANVVFCQKGIDDIAQHYLAKDNIFALRRVKKSDMEKLAKATGGKIVSNLEDLSENELGKAKKVEEQKIGDSEFTFVTGCEHKKALSILVRGGTAHVVDEVDRALHDALKVVGVTLEEQKIVAGGGATEIELSMKLKKFAASVGGREQLAIECFAEALEIIPWTLSENAGLDSIDTLIKLRTEHEKGEVNKHVGIDVFTGEPKNMLDERRKIIEPLKVKRHAVLAATDVASMVLRIDDVVASKKSEGPPMPPGGGMPPGMGGMGGMPPGMM